MGKEDIRERIRQQTQDNIDGYHQRQRESQASVQQQLNLQRQFNEQGQLEAETINTLMSDEDLNFLLQELVDRIGVKHSQAIKRQLATAEIITGPLRQGAKHVTVHFGQIAIDTKIGTLKFTFKTGKPKSIIPVQISDGSRGAYNNEAHFETLKERLIHTISYIDAQRAVNAEGFYGWEVQPLGLQVEFEDRSMNA